MVDFPITEKLIHWNTQNQDAWHELMPQIYDELRSKARVILARQSTPVLEPTVLVHELYLNFKKPVDLQWKNRQHFFAVLALAMRQLVVDEVIRKNAKKRGGDNFQITLNDVGNDASYITVQLFDLNKALDNLERVNAESAKIVELRYFGGLTLEEVADILECNERSVRRKWEWAKTWLYRHLSE